jgi:hypothetical protein
MLSLPRLVLALSIAAACLAPTITEAQQPPVYSRMRQGADDWHARGGGFGYSFPSYAYGGFFPPYAPPVVVTGSWYQRPYPYHFDVARQRWGGPPQAYQQELAPRSDCPCAEQITPTPAE